MNTPAPAAIQFLFYNNFLVGGYQFAIKNTLIGKCMPCSEKLQVKKTKHNFFSSILFIYLFILIE